MGAVFLEVMVLAFLILELLYYSTIGIVISVLLFAIWVLIYVFAGPEENEEVSEDEHTDETEAEDMQVAESPVEATRVEKPEQPSSTLSSEDSVAIGHLIYEKWRHEDVEANDYEADYDIDIDDEFDDAEYAEDIDDEYEDDDGYDDDYESRYDDDWDNSREAGGLPRDLSPFYDIDDPYEREELEYEMYEEENDLFFDD